MNRLKFSFLLLFCLVSLITFAQKKERDRYVKITSSHGEVILKLYNETPLHRDNFVKLTKNRYYDGTIFHRIIKAFMIQGGGHRVDKAFPDSLLTDKKADYTIPAEFNDRLFHKKGALAAARMGDQVNPQKESSGSQFYIVQGRVWTDSLLTNLEKNRLKFQLPEWQREVYKSIGGSPHLDRNYTVFGEVVKGLEVVDSIAAVPTGKGDRPTDNILMKVSLLNKRAVKKLFKNL